MEKERNRLKKAWKKSDSSRLAKIESDLKELRELIKEMEKSYVERASVVGVTLSKAAMDPLIYQQEFDLIVVDEASMAYVPQIAFASSLGKRIVVCGDFKQLPPIAMSDSKVVNHWLKEDIFHHAKIVEAVQRGQIHPNLVMLTEQRRMHPDISAFTNASIYNGRVFDYKKVREDRGGIAEKEPFKNEAATIIDVTRMGAYCLKDSSSDSRYNVYSALLSMQLVLKARHHGIRSIGIIAPYKAHTRFLSACIQDLIDQDISSNGEREVVSATVHKFQGSERDMIIFDAVDSYPQPRAGVLLTNEDGDRLVNVAVTRARGKFINIVDKKYLQSRVSSKRAMYQLVDHLYEKNEFYTRHELGDVMFQTFDDRLRWYDQGQQERVAQDILGAKKNIVLSIPDLSKVHRKVWESLKEVQNRIRITIITPDPKLVPLQKCDGVPNNLIMPFITLDDEVLWAGTPVMDSTRFEGSPQPPFLMARLKSKRAIKIFVSFLDIKIAKVQVEKVVTTYRPSYTLKQFVTSWDNCPTCRSIREPEITPKGKIRLVCKHCGNGGAITRKILSRYIDHIDLKCRKCNSLLEAKGSRGNTYIECERCQEVVDVMSLW